MSTSEVSETPSALSESLKLGAAAAVKVNNFSPPRNEPSCFPPSDGQAGPGA